MSGKTGKVRQNIQQHQTYNLDIFLSVFFFGLFLVSHGENRAIDHLMSGEFFVIL